MSQAAIILFVSLVVFLILNVPVGIAIGLASLCVVFNSSRLSDSFMVQQLITGTDSFPIMAIPLFILAGELMAAGGVSKRILNVCSAYFGHITGGLAIVTVVVCMFFAAVSGSGPATVAAVGAMVVPAMLEKGYSKSFTLACIACSGCIGVIIPPSIHPAQHPHGHLRRFHHDVDHRHVHGRFPARHLHRSMPLPALLLLLQEDGLEGR